MTLVRHVDGARADAELRGLAAQLGLMVDVRGIDACWDDHIVDRIERLLRRSLDLLADHASELGLDDVAGWQVLATRDAVASHLRAADHLDVAQARPEVRANVLIAAAERLLDDVRPGRA